MKVKTLPEDFIVKEKYTLPEFKEKAGQSYVLIKKNGISFHKAIYLISTFFSISEKQIGYAGIKDKQAITEQVISLKGIRKEHIAQFSSKELNLTFLGYAKEPVVLGSHLGNTFIITVRDINQEPEEKKNYVNYFGEQRFSTNNKEIGKYLVLKKYKEALQLMLETKIDLKKRIAKYLEEKPNDHLTAIRMLPMRFLSLYIHAYQSYIWNKTVMLYLKKMKNEIKNKKIQIIGFGYDHKDKEVDDIIQNILKEEKITERDFVNRQFSGLTSEGTERNLYMDIHKLSVGSLSKDELHPGKKKVVVTFFLGKGSYATEVIKQLFNQKLF